MRVTPIGFSNYIWWSPLWNAPEYAMAKCIFQLDNWCIHEMHSAIPIWFGVHVVHSETARTTLVDNAETTAHSGDMPDYAHRHFRMELEMFVLHISDTELNGGMFNMFIMPDSRSIVRALEKHINRGAFYLHTACDAERVCRE